MTTNQPAKGYAELFALTCLHQGHVCKHNDPRWRVTGLKKIAHANAKMIIPPPPHPNPTMATSPKAGRGPVREIELGAVGLSARCQELNDDEADKQGELKSKAADDAWQQDGLFASYFCFKDDFKLRRSVATIWSSTQALEDGDLGTAVEKFTEAMMLGGVPWHRAES